MSDLSEQSLNIADHIIDLGLCIGVINAITGKRGGFVSFTRNILVLSEIASVIL